MSCFHMIRTCLSKFPASWDTCNQTYLPWNHFLIAEFWDSEAWSAHKKHWPGLKGFIWALHAGEPRQWHPLSWCHLLAPPPQYICTSIASAYWLPLVRYLSLCGGQLSICVLKIPNLNISETEMCLCCSSQYIDGDGSHLSEQLFCSWLLVVGPWGSMNMQYRNHKSKVCWHCIGKYHTLFYKTYLPILISWRYHWEASEKPQVSGDHFNPLTR